jgi:hypothetical protein
MIGVVDLLGGLLADIGAENVTIGLSILLGGWYLWKGKKMAGILGAWGSRMIFTVVIIAVLLLTGVLEGVDFQAAADLIGTVWNVATGLFAEVAG